MTLAAASREAKVNFTGMMRENMSQDTHEDLENMSNVLMRCRVVEGVMEARQALWSTHHPHGAVAGWNESEVHCSPFYMIQREGH